MKIAVFSHQGRSRLGIVHREGLVDTGLTPDLVGLLKQDPGLGKLFKVPHQGPFLSLSGVKILPPVTEPSKIICVGLNYLDHCKENNLPMPQSPVLFSKFPSAIVGDGDLIIHPAITQKLDFEAELAIVIGRQAKAVPEAKALNYVAGYTICNDVSARDIQAADGQWVRAKSLDTFAPLGPWLVTPEEIPDPSHLSIQCRLNGELVQNSNTSEMIFKVPYLIAFISQAITLYPGDIISTGTPSGVGQFRNPPLFMKPGDVVEVEIEKIGKLKNKIIAQQG